MPHVRKGFTNWIDLNDCGIWDEMHYANRMIKDANKTTLWVSSYEQMEDINMMGQ